MESFVSEKGNQTQNDFKGGKMWPQNSPAPRTAHGRSLLSSSERELLVNYSHTTSCALVGAQWLERWLTDPRVVGLSPGRGHEPRVKVDPQPWSGASSGGNLTPDPFLNTSGPASPH